MDKNYQTSRKTNSPSVPESIVNALLTGIRGDMLYGHEGQFKTKERIMQYYWWRGMDQYINNFLAKCENLN
jgi:hypothetical protein